MIRHITTETAYNKIKTLGYIVPQGDGNETTPEKGYSSFELYRKNNNFCKAYYLGNIDRYKNLEKLIILYLDENQLIKAGFDVIITDDTLRYRQTKNGKEFCTKKENDLFVMGNQITQQEYDEIGNYVFVKGNIPISFINYLEVVDLKNIK